MSDVGKDDNLIPNRSFNVSLHRRWKWRKSTASIPEGQSAAGSHRHSQTVRTVSPGNTILFTVQQYEGVTCHFSSSLSVFVLTLLHIFSLSMCSMCSTFSLFKLQFECHEGQYWHIFIINIWCQYITISTLYLAFYFIFLCPKMIIIHFYCESN